METDRLKNEHNTLDQKNDIVENEKENKQTQNLKDQKNRMKRNKTHKNDKNALPFQIKTQIFLYFVLLTLNILILHIIRPAMIMLSIVFLARISLIDPDYSDHFLTTMPPYNIIGYIILFILPLYNFFAVGFKVLFIRTSFWIRLYYSILLLIEIIINTPLTFLYGNNNDSIFLFYEDNINQLIAPSLIFYPTNYVTSVFEIIRNLIQSLFFIGVGFIKLNGVGKSAYSQGFLIIILYILIALCVMNVFHIIVVIVVRIRRGKIKRVESSNIRERKSNSDNDQQGKENNENKNKDD